MGEPRGLGRIGVGVCCKSQWPLMESRCARARSAPGVGIAPAGVVLVLCLRCTDLGVPVLCLRCDVPVEGGGSLRSSRLAVASSRSLSDGMSTDGGDAFDEAGEEPADVDASGVDVRASTLPPLPPPPPPPPSPSSSSSPFSSLARSLWSSAEATAMRHKPQRTESTPRE